MPIELFARGLAECHLVGPPQALHEWDPESVGRKPMDKARDVTTRVAFEVDPKPGAAGPICRIHLQDRLWTKRSGDN